MNYKSQQMLESVTVEGAPLMPWKSGESIGAVANINSKNTSKLSHNQNNAAAATKKTTNLIIVESAKVKAKFSHTSKGVSV